MQNFLNNFRLSVKINFAIAISLMVMIFISVILYMTIDFFINNIQKNNQSLIEVRSVTQNIEKNLRYLNYITIDNAVEELENNSGQNNFIYKVIFNSLNDLKENSFFNNDIKALELIKKINIRVQGYQNITSTLGDEVEEDTKDGLYAILALTSTSQVISNELEELNTLIVNISNQNIKNINKQIDKIKIIVLIVVLLLFLLVLYINKVIISLILIRIDNLKDQIISFFDLLTHKRTEVIHINDNAKDEIAEIAHVIDENMYIAERVLLQERKESERIEVKVKDAIKEIVQLNEEIEATQREIVFTMGAVAEERSKETGNHVKRVAEYSLILARFYGLSLKESILIKNASPMHDIGKIGIPDSILNKPAKLTDEEFEIMKSHSEIGYRMLKYSDKSILKAASILAYEHHERWDGKGYPRGLKGDEIHIYGRITAIVDVFDALGSERIYKKAWSIQKIIKLFNEEKGKQFDPVLIEIFLDNLSHFMAAKEMIERDSSGIVLSEYIENFEKVDEFVGEN